MDYEDILDEEQIKSQELWDALSWWEQRRLKYNIIVGLSGIPAFGIVSLTARYPPSIEEIIAFVLFYGIFANTAYLSGWVFDILLKYYLNIKLSITIRSILFGAGTIVALAPSILVILDAFF